MRLRSLLFVPGDRADRFDKACRSGADRVVVDLEDAVAPQEKEVARAVVYEWLETTSFSVYLRINSAETPWFEKDLELCKLTAVAGVMLPKAESAEAVQLVAARGKPLLPLIETAVGYSRLQSIASSNGVQRLVFGHVDFQQDLGILADGCELLYFRSGIVLASRVAGLEGPVDGVCLALDDIEAIRHEATNSRLLGFAGKLCIHPKQVEIVNAAFRPTAAEVEWAKRVQVAVAEDAIATVDGKLVDRPVAERAKAILMHAEFKT